MTKRTSSPGKNKKSSAFTLIEVLLVIALLGVLAAALVPDLDRVFRTSVQSSVRQFSALVRFAFDQSVLTGKVHRVVLDLDKQRWAVEVGKPGELPQETVEDERKNQSSNNEKKKEDSFTEVKNRIVAPLPKGVQLLWVESSKLGDKSQSKGVVYLYTYPNGWIDDAVLALSEQGKDQVQQFLVKVHPLTGKISLESKTEGLQR